MQSNFCEVIQFAFNFSFSSHPYVPVQRRVAVAQEEPNALIGLMMMRKRLTKTMMIMTKLRRMMTGKITK